MSEKQILLRVPSNIHRKLKVLAAKQVIPLNKLVLNAIDIIINTSDRRVNLAEALPRID